MTDMVRITITPPDFAYSNTQDVYGGKQINVMIAPDVVEAVRWVQEYRSRLDKEVQLRMTNPALASQWEQYQTMLKLVMDDL